MEAFRSQLPSSEDVRGVADHVLRLRSVYNLTTEHVLSGRLMGLEALRPMRMQECFLLVDVAYQGLLLDEFKLWYEACQAVISQNLQLKKHTFIIMSSDDRGKNFVVSELAAKHVCKQTSSDGGLG